MNPNWLGVISAVLAFAAFSVAYRVARKAGITTRLRLTAVAVLLAIPGGSFATYYAHIFPEPSWYFKFRSIPLTEFLLVFVGLAGGMVASTLPRKLLILPLLGVAAFSIAPIIKPFIGPLSDEPLRNEWSDDVCLQSTPSTCGAATVATILRHLGENTSESELAAEAHSYSGGTEAWYLARAARARGMEVRFEFKSGFAPEIELPAVAGVRLGRIGHFIPILAREEESFVIGDPLQGRELLSQEQLQQRYEFTGFYMPIQKK